MHVRQILRAEKWWEHILPPIFLCYYSSLLADGHAPLHPFVKALCLAAICILTAFAGYFINDLFDIPADRKAGKKNYVSRFPVWLRWLFMPALLGLVALLLFVFAQAGVLNATEFSLVVLVFLGNLLLFLLYSVPPVRLKEKPMLAPVADALYSGTLFYGLAYLLSLGLSPETGSGTDNLVPVLIRENRLLTAFLAWGFLKGLRNYLNHLAEDAEHDALSGIRTLATRYGAARIRSIANGIYPAELILLACLMTVLSGPLALFALAFCAIFLGFWIRDMRQNRERTYHLYNDLHEVWLPVTFLTLLILEKPGLYPLALMHLALFPYHIPKLYFSFKKVIFVLFNVEWSFRKT